MSKSIRLGAALALVLVCASAAYAGGRDLLYKPQYPNVAVGEIYLRSEIFPPLPDGDILPFNNNGMDLVEGAASDANSGSALAGPVAVVEGKMGVYTAEYGVVNGASAALPGSTGGSFMTPRRQADMEIRRLIKRLN